MPLLLFVFEGYPSQFPQVLLIFLRNFSELPAPFAHKRFVDIVQFSEMPRGGHFAALEEPQLFASDVIKFIDKVEKRSSLQKDEAISKSQS